MWLTKRLPACVAFQRVPCDVICRIMLQAAWRSCKRFPFHRPQSELAQYREVLAAAFSEQPPATVAEAAARIQASTGIERKPTQVRHFLKTLGMKPLKVGMIPAKADAAAQELFKKKSWSRD